MSHGLHVRSKDDVLNGHCTDRKKDPPLTPEIQKSINDLENSTLPPTADDYNMIGNMCYNGKMFTTAIKYYTKAVNTDPKNWVHYSNRSAAYLNSIMLAGSSMAIKDADQAIKLKPDWYKGYLRKGDVLFIQDKLDAAIEAYDKALCLYPECDSAITSKEECIKRKMLKSENVISSERTVNSTQALRRDLSNSKTESERKITVDCPTTEQTEELIKTWSRDTNMDNNLTGTKKYNRSVEEADRELGRTVKEMMMGNFRNKLDSDEMLKEKVMNKIESEKVKGAGYDYLRTEKNLKVLSNGTNEVGHAISADSYLSYKYESNAW